MAVHIPSAAAGTSGNAHRPLVAHRGASWPAAQDGAQLSMWAARRASVSPLMAGSVPMAGRTR